MICSEMTNMLDTDKRLESIQINGYSERRSVFIVLNTLQPFVPQFLENKLLSCLLLELTPMDVG